MKKTIRRIYMASPYDRRAMETYFEQMAGKGWMLKEQNGIFWKFESCEPKRVRFQVNYFDKATIFDSNPEKKTREYIEYCRACGWNYLNSMGKMQIFYTEDMEIPPIQTDDGIQLKSMAKATVWNIILWLVLAIQQFFMLRQTVIDLMTGKHWYQFAETVSSSFRLGLGVFQIVFISLCVCAILRFLVFFMRNIIRIRPGRGMFLVMKDSVTIVLEGDLSERVVEKLRTAYGL